MEIFKILLFYFQRKFIAVKPAVEPHSISKVVVERGSAGRNIRYFKRIKTP